MLYEQISNNRFRTFLLFLVFILFVSGVGYVYGESSGFGMYGLMIALVFALMSSFFTYYYSDSIVLSVSGARALGPKENPYLENTIEGLALAAGIPKPRIYVIDDPSPNAFATGRDPQHAAIAVTTGLVEMMDRLELEGVIAHEMSHIKNLDIRLAMVAAVLVGVVTMMSEVFFRSMWLGGGKGGRSRGGGNGLPIFFILGIVLAILSPIIAQTLQLALSRNREYLADASGAMLTRYPEGLASALTKLSENLVPMQKTSKATAHIWFAQPLNLGKSVNRMFNTHPPIQDRIDRLMGSTYKKATLSVSALDKLDD